MMDISILLSRVHGKFDRGIVFDNRFRTCFDRKKEKGGPLLTS